MNPSQEKALKEHIQAIAKILYEQTSPEQLKDLETIEATVRQQVTEYVSPELGIFLSKKRQEQAPEESEN
ncbi:MAG TPA: hypothetical protein DCY91_23290 [Cyanobacteria bacterium UBA11370]|nr:hypothetical protein [Cyanobacteria bacterium UBA11370]